MNQRSVSVGNATGSDWNSMARFVQLDTGRRWRVLTAPAACPHRQQGLRHNGPQQYVEWFDENICRLRLSAFGGVGLKAAVTQVICEHCDEPNICGYQRPNDGEHLRERRAEHIECRITLLLYSHDNRLSGSLNVRPSTGFKVGAQWHSGATAVARTTHQCQNNSRPIWLPKGESAGEKWRHAQQTTIAGTDLVLRGQDKYGNSRCDAQTCRHSESRRAGRRRRGNLIINNHHATDCLCTQCRVLLTKTQCTKT